VLRELLRTPQTLYTAGIMLIISIASMLSGSFWAILVTEKLHIPAQHIAVFPFIRSASMLLFFFVVMPRLDKRRFQRPMAIGFLVSALSQVVLITSPDRGYPALVLSVVLEACSFAAISPLVDQMTVLTISAEERARIQSILSVGIILLTSPFGWIGGTLSEISKDLPFMLSTALFVVGAGLAYVAGARLQRKGIGN
jgi:MFS family permease